MQDFASRQGTSKGTMVRIEANRYADISDLLSMVAGEGERIFGINTLIHVTNAIRSNDLASFPGVSLPPNVDFVMAKQLETPPLLDVVAPKALTTACVAGLTPSTSAAAAAADAFVVWSSFDPRAKAVVPYPDNVAALLERAYKIATLTVDLTIEGATFTVDLRQMRQCSAFGTHRHVQRTEGGVILGGQRCDECDPLTQVGLQPCSTANFLTGGNLDEGTGCTSPALSTPLNHFERVFGFTERTYEETQRTLVANYEVNPRGGGGLLLGAGNRRWRVGCFSIRSVSELHARISTLLSKMQLKKSWKVTVGNVVGESDKLHNDPKYQGAVFQVASQFNCLELASSTTTPEDGITAYMCSSTKGSACAIACYAGTAYRNYLIPMKDGSRGQRRSSQINCLRNMEYVLRKYLLGQPWKLRNGYLESSDAALTALNKLIGADWADKAKNRLRYALLDSLDVGIQSDTEVTNDDEGPARDQLVTQVFTPAVAVGCSSCDAMNWEPISRLILEGIYQSTLLVGVLNNLKRMTQNLPPAPVLLTVAGGNVFPSDASRVMDAIARAVNAVGRYGVPLEVLMTHKSSVDPAFELTPNRMPS